MQVDSDASLNDDMYSFEKKSSDLYVRTGTAVTRYAPQTGRVPGMTGYGGTSYGAAAESTARPMTSVKAAGYSSRGRAPGGQVSFDPFNQAGMRNLRSSRNYRQA